MRLNRVVLLAIIGVFLAAATGSAQTDERTDVHLRNDCRLAAQILETGTPDPHYDWALRMIGSCATSGSEPMRKLWATNEVDTTRLNAIYHSSRELWDRQLLEVVRDAAQDPGRPLNVRLNAMRTLASYAHVHAYVRSLERFPTSAELGRTCVSSGDHDRRFATDEPPADGSPEAIVQLLRQLSDTDATPRIRFAAACVLDYLSVRVGVARTDPN